MDKKSYFEVIVSCMEIAKDVEEERLKELGGEDEYQEGIVRGLQIACDKLNLSKFLVEAK